MRCVSTAVRHDVTDTGLQAACTHFKLVLLMHKTEMDIRLLEDPE